MAGTPAAAHAASDTSPARYAGWRSVPEHLRTLAQWKKQGRTVTTASKKAPAAVVDWNGIQAKVYSEEQTRPYNPRPATVAFRGDCQAFTTFLNLRRDRHAFKPRKDWEYKDWPQTTEYLSDDTLQRAYSHREGLAFLPAAAGGFRYYILDLDFHRPAADPGRFLAQVAAVHNVLVEEGDDFFMAAREKNISGLHFWVFGEEELPLALVLGEANRIKAELIDCHPDLFNSSPEVYPDPDRPFRLPIFPGRCPILDVPLEGMPPRDQLARLLQWIDEPGKPMRKGDLLDWVRARLPKAASVCVGGMPTTIADTAAPSAAVPDLAMPPKSPPGCVGGRPTTIADTAAPPLPPMTEDDSLDELDIDPNPGYLPGEDYFAEKARADLAGRLEEWERVRSLEGARAAMAFLDGLAVPPAAAVKEHLAFGKTPEEIDAYYRRELLDRPDLSFSRRLSENPEKIFRSELATARKIERDNGYQPDPAASTAIFRRLAAAFRRRGLDPLDPTAFGRYRRSGKIDSTPREVELGEEVRDKVLKHAGWLHRDAEVVLKAARLVAGFVEANPGRQMAAVLVPDLCGELPVKWLCDSDRKARRCKKGERFLASLVAASVLEVARLPLFLGLRNPDNRATEYALGEAVRASGREGEANY